MVRSMGPHLKTLAHRFKNFVSVDRRTNSAQEDCFIMSKVIEQRNKSNSINTSNYQSRIFMWLYVECKKVKRVYNFLWNFAHLAALWPELVAPLSMGSLA